MRCEAFSKRSGYRCEMQATMPAKDAEGRVLMWVCGTHLRTLRIGGKIRRFDDPRFVVGKAKMSSRGLRAKEL
jgi:hypothetical protein